MTYLTLKKGNQCHNLMFNWQMTAIYTARELSGILSKIKFTTKFTMQAVWFY